MTALPFRGLVQNFLWWMRSYGFTVFHCWDSQTAVCIPSNLFLHMDNVTQSSIYCPYNKGYGHKETEKTVKPINTVSFSFNGRPYAVYACHLPQGLRCREWMRLTRRFFRHLLALYPKYNFLWVGDFNLPSQFVLNKVHESIGMPQVNYWAIDYVLCGGEAQVQSLTHHRLWSNGERLSDHDIALAHVRL